MHWLRKAVSKILVSASNVVWIHKRANSTSQRQRSLGEWPSTSDGQTLWLLWQLKGQNLENLLSTFCPDSHPGWLTFPHSCPQSWLTTMYQWSSLFQFSTTVLLPSTHFCASVFFLTIPIDSSLSPGWPLPIALISIHTSQGASVNEKGRVGTEEQQTGLWNLWSIKPQGNEMQYCWSICKICWTLDSLGEEQILQEDC